MKYVIVTVEWCLSKGIIVPDSARRSLDRTKVIFHYDFVKPVLKEEESIEVYGYNSEELNDILNGPEWSGSPEKEEMT